MTSVSAKFLQGEPSGRGAEPSAELLQSSDVVAKNKCEEDDLKNNISSNRCVSVGKGSQISREDLPQGSTAFTVHHQAFLQNNLNSSSSINSNPPQIQSLGYTETPSANNSSPLHSYSSSSTSNSSYPYYPSSSSSSSNFFGKRSEDLSGSRGSQLTPLSEMQQDFYRPYSLQTSPHLHPHHPHNHPHGSSSYSFGHIHQPHHIIHHHPSTSSGGGGSSPRVLHGCGESPPTTSSISSNPPPPPSVPSSFNQSPQTSSANSPGSSYNQNNQAAPSFNPSSSSPSNEYPGGNNNNNSSNNNSGGFLPPDSYERPLYRPHPTRPASGPPAMPPPPPTSSPVNASSTSSSVVAAAAGSSSSSGSGPRSQFTRVISSPPHQSSSQQGAQNNPPSGSPSSLILASSPPTAACSPTPVSTPKFRYPSGPSGASPRTTTPSSTLSSREGTPLPSDVGSAPNVDISRVHLEDFFHNNYSPSSSSSSSTPTRGAAAIKSEFPPQGSAFSSLSAYNAPGFLYGPQQFLGSPPPAPSQQCITLSQRSQMRSSSSKSGLDFPGAPRGRRPGSTSAAAVNLGGGGANVKIGRRPAHLPKNLKFDDKTLPPGWVRKLKQRKHGKQAGRWDVYIYSPCGVKFASRKKLKSFFEKNNLNYDPEDFDFTPYGRHLDAAARASASSNNNNSSGSSALLGNSGSSDLINSGRHNSSGSTGSEGTHEGSSPASLQNCSPTHHPPHGASSLYPSVSGPSFGSHLSGAEYSYPSFDPLMENPPNASALDVPAPPPGTEIYNHRIQLKNESRSSPAGYFPMEMAEILGDGTLNGIVPSQDSSNLSPSSAALHQSAAHLGQLHAVAASHHSTLNSPSSFSDLRSRMLGESPESEDNAAAKNMRPLLNPPPLGSSELQPLEKTFSIRNTISLLESGNDPYTNYPEYE